MYTIPPNLYFLPMEHRCGCCIDWGIDQDKPHYLEQLRVFISLASMFPCPWHGSVTLMPSTTPHDDNLSYLVGNDMWYKLITERERKLLAKANAKIRMNQP